MNLSFKENYWENLSLRSEYINFIEQIHNFDLGVWNKNGFWDKKYRPFSYFDGSTLVSSTCLYTMEMIIEGKFCQVAQISGVGTLPNYRKRGLSGELTQKAIEWAKKDHEFFYLFANKDAYSFYEKFGFNKVEEYKTKIQVEGKPAVTGAVKLDMNLKESIDLIHNCSLQREPVSNLLGVLNSNLLMFYCLGLLKDLIYYIDELELTVLYQRKNGVLTIFDLVGKNIPEFSKIYPFISSESDKRVLFEFMVDKLNLKNLELVKAENTGLHIMGNFPLSGSNFVFPFTSQS